MKTLEIHAGDYLAFALKQDLNDVITLVRLVREEALDTVAALARKYNTKEFLEFADKVEALKSLP